LEHIFEIGRKKSGFLSQLLLLFFNGSKKRKNIE